jgi:hypothetical protein
LIHPPLGVINDSPGGGIWKCAKNNRKRLDRVNTGIIKGLGGGVGGGKWDDAGRLECYYIWRFLPDERLDATIEPTKAWLPPPLPSAAKGQRLRYFFQKKKRLTWMVAQSASRKRSGTVSRACSNPFRGSPLIGSLVEHFATPRRFSQ